MAMYARLNQHWKISAAKIDAFLWENLRAVVVLEGIEYLSSLHGDDRIVNFLA